MATTTTPPLDTRPVPQTPTGTPIAAVKKAVSDIKDGFHPLRPFHYAWSFISGSVAESLGDMATYGRKGSWWGVGIAAVLIVSGVTGGLGALVVGWVGGLAVGAVGGGTVGLLTGGVRTIDREHRRDKYADDLLVRAKAKSQPVPRADYREDYRDHHTNANYFVDRIFQQDREIAQQTRQESHGFFQDMVHHSRSGHHEQGY